MRKVTAEDIDRIGPVFSEKCNYILGNPVRKGLCAEPSDWPHVAVFSRVSGGRAACPNAAGNSVDIL